MRLSNVVPLLIFFVVGILLAYATNLPSKASFIPSMVGSKLENFQITELSTNKPFTNSDVTENDITVLNLFASWCSSCKYEHELVKTLAQQGLVIYGLDVADTQDAALAYLKENGNPYKKVGFDPQQRVAISLGSTGVPETFVVDKTGTIYFHQRGVLTEDIVKRQLLPIIDGMKKNNQ